MQRQFKSGFQAYADLESLKVRFRIGIVQNIKKLGLQS